MGEVSLNSFDRRLFRHSMEMFVRYMGSQLQHCRKNTDPIYYFDSLSSLVVLNEDDLWTCQLIIVRSKKMW